MPSQKELADAIAEENAAMLEFAKVSKRAETVEVERKAARHRLMLARAAKDALFVDLMHYGTNQS